MNRKKILYIEISTAHTEIIHSFVEALTPEYEVHLLINEKSLPRMKSLNPEVKVSALNEANYLQDILTKKKEISPDLILLNSAQGRKIRDLCLRLLFDPTPVVGVHHNAENIFKSFTQKMIHWKIKKYIVLADFIKDFLLTKINTAKTQIESFYPLAYHQGPRTKVDAKFKYILIPGVLEQDRRDYLGFVEMVKNHKKELYPWLKFVLLGNSKNHDGPKVIDAIAVAGLQDRFILFDRYVEDETLLSYAEKSMAIMPLMHPGTRWFDKYFETKISGAYSLAFAFDKPLLMHEVFRGKPEFAHHGVFYNGDTLPAAILDLEKLPPISRLEKFNFAFQKKKLLEFLIV
jgi:hypothetical protein